MPGVGGAKNYGYKVNTGETHCKIRGFTLNFKNSQVLNFDSMKEIICKYVDSADSLDVVNDCKITREKWTRRLVNKVETKTYQVVYDKRIILGQGEDTIPFGYIWTPATNATAPLPVHFPSIPEYLLYSSQLHPVVVSHEQQTQMECDGMDVADNDIDLMDTDDETDDDYESADDSDLAFLDDIDNMDTMQDVSFYRRFDNSF